MKNSSDHSLIWLFVRSLLPSSTSVLLSVVGAIVFIVLGLLFWSVTYGTILPSFFGGELATLYTNFVVQPIDTLTHTTLWDGGLTILLYSLFGAVLYQLITSMLGSYTGWRRTKRYVHFNSQSTVTHSQLDRSFLFLLAWRLGVGIVAILLLIALAPLLHWMLSNVQSTVVATNAKTVAINLSLIFLSAVLLLHCVVVLLRLYTMRTRLFGDDIVYESHSRS